jgi:nucleoside-diphosphate-sugar epimerase
MRVFLAGASGTIGPPLISRLVADDHQVFAMTRSEAKRERLAELGAEPVVADAFDPSGLTAGMGEARPDVVINHLTDLSGAFSSARPGKAFAGNDRLRAEGGPNVSAAARAAGARRLVAQSVAFFYAPEGSLVKSESDPLYVDAPKPGDRSVGAVAALERTVTDAADLDGVVLRFGFWYGAGTAYAPDGAIARLVAKRRYPIVGDGSAIYSFVHIDDVVEATVAALDSPPGVYNVTDDDPARAAEWMPAYAEALGAPPPRRFPRLAVRLAMGRFAEFMVTGVRGASNEKAKRELGWTPRHTTWRTGFQEALGA